MFGSTFVRRNARTLLPAIGILGTIGAFVACSNDNDIVVPGVTGTVVTFKDSTFDFTTLHTFAIVDSVVHVAPLTGTPLDVTRQFDAVAIAQVRNDLLSRGYVEISNPATVTPDFVVLVSAAATTNFNAFVGFPWFTSFGFSPAFAFGVFDPSWGIVFPWFPVVGTTAFDRGTLLVEIVPTSSVNNTNKTIRAVWAGVATALLNGAVTSDAVTAAINAMFVQSPYLTATPPLQ